MGACDFYTLGVGKTAREAFRAAVDKASWEHGHGGYTGTIAEKHEAIPITFKIDERAPHKDRLLAARAHAESLIRASDKRIDDKWGPAGYIDLGPAPEPYPKGMRGYLFFGWASS